MKMAMTGVDLVIFYRGLELIVHVTHGKEMDERGDEGHHHEHDGRQHIDAISHAQESRSVRVLLPAGTNRCPDNRTGPASFDTFALPLHGFHRLGSFGVFL